MTSEIPTVGIEEEYLLVDPESGEPVPAVEKVRRAAQDQPALEDEDVEHELLQVQLEISTPVCHSLDEAGGHLLRLRSQLAEAADSVGCRLVSTGAAPVAPTDQPRVSATDRYRSMYERAPRLVDEFLLNGLHVHVAVPSAELRVAVLNRLRPWLPVLVALGANSPFWEGRETGFASWRTIHFNRWPVSGPPPPFADAADYERRVAALLETGSVIDRGQLYWQARVSHRYPTVELRVADAQLRVDDSVLIAGLLRGLVMTALGAEERSLPNPQPTEELLRAASWQAGRHGLDDTLVDVVHGGHVPAADAVDELLEHITPALQQLGDLDQVTGLLARHNEAGTGARRQRAAAQGNGLPGVLALLSEQFVAV